MRRAPPPRLTPGMACTFCVALVALLPVAACAAAGKKTDAKPHAEGLIAQLKASLPMTPSSILPSLNWPEVLRTTLLHVDYWILIAVAFVVASRVTQRAADRKLRRVKAAMDFSRHRDATYTSVETGMLEWINHLVRHEWRSLIGSAVDQRARETLETQLQDSGARSGGVLKNAQIKELTLGVVPPDLKLYVSRYNPRDDYVQFEFDFKWDTVQSHIFLLCDVNVAGACASASSFLPGVIRSFTNALPSVRVPIHVTDLSISGKLLLGIRLSDRQPGMSGLDVSFNDPPTVNLSIQTAGVPVNDVPGVKEFIEGKIGNIFAASYVEPKRMFVDVEGYFLTRFPISGIDGTGIGTGGSLVVDVDGCERLPSTHSTQKMANPYLELTFGGVTKRTATQINTINPSWKTRLAFPVSKQSGDTSNSKKSDSRSLRVRVMDWSPLHEPRCIGYASCVVDIPALRAAARNAKSSWARDISSDANGGALGLTKITVPLRGTRGGVLRLSLATVVGTGVADDTSIVVSTTPRGQDSSPVGGFDPNAEEYGEYVEPSGNDASGLDESTFPIGEAYATTPEPVPLVRAADDAEYDSFQADPVSSVTSSDGNGGSSSAVHLLQLARLAKQKRDEQRMFSDTNSTLKTDLNNVQEQLSMEKELRKAELRRALVEGALFTCHTKRKPGFEPGLYRFRYLSSKKQFVWAEGSKLTTKPKLHQFVPVSLIRECVVGVEKFTLGADGDPRMMQSRDEARRAALKKKAKKKKRRFLPKHGPVGLAKKAGNNISNMLMASKKNGEHDPSRCFSIQLWKPDSVENNISDTVMGSGAAGLGLISIDLELPAGGNGRSVREWCDAIESVAGENGGGTLLDDDDDDDETVMSPKGNEVGVLLPSKSVSRRSRETSRVKIVETENGQKSDDEKNAVASESTAPLKRRVSLPKHALGIGDKGPSEGTMLTIPIPPEHGGEEELGVGGEK